MFCPEGYVSLYELRSAFWAFAQDLWENEWKAFYVAEESKKRSKVLPDGSAIGNYVDFDPDDTDVHYAYQQWATFRLTRRNRELLLVCSPDGRVMRLADYAYDAENVWDGPFPETQRQQVALVDHLEKGHFHISEHYGIISPCSDSKRLGAFDLADVVAMLKPFEGWAVCWKPRDFSKWRSELRTLLREEGQLAPILHHGLAKERRAAQQIVALFDQDDQITKDTCKAQGVGAELGSNAFARAWAEAGKMRPALLAPGRRRAKSAD